MHLLVAIGVYFAAVTALAAWLDIRAGKVEALCENEKPSTMVAAWSWVGLPIVLVLAMALWPSASHARDDGRYANSALKPWFDSLKSKGGGPCCSDADGTALSDVDWETRDGHYRVRIDGNWIDVPDDTVITEPNRAGRTMVWPFYLNGRPTIRCFMPGSMT